MGLRVRRDHRLELEVESEMATSYCSPRRRKSCTAKVCINGLDPMPRSCTLSLVSGVRYAAVGSERVLELLPHTLVWTISPQSILWKGSIESTLPSSRDQFQSGYRGETLRVRLCISLLGIVNW